MSAAGSGLRQHEAWQNPLQPPQLPKQVFTHSVSPRLSKYTVAYLHEQPEVLCNLHHPTEAESLSSECPHGQSWHWSLALSAELYTLQEKASPMPPPAFPCAFLFSSSKSAQVPDKMFAWNSSRCCSVTIFHLCQRKGLQIWGAETIREEPLSAVMEGLQNAFVIRGWGRRDIAGPTRGLGSSLPRSTPQDHAA